MNRHFLGSLVVLYVLWLVLSGHWDNGLLLTLGALSAVGVALLGWRMEVVDEETYPLHVRPGRFVVYWGWLIKEIALANVDVARRILARDLPISPIVFRIKTSERSALGRVIYANSITLTPGTVSTEVGEDYIEVHALTREAAEAVQAGEMDRRVAELEAQR